MNKQIKNIALLIFIQIISFSLRAQVDEIIAPMQQQNIDVEENTKTKVGVKFGMGFHKFRGDAFDNEKLKFGTSVGFYNLIPLNKKKTNFLHYEVNFTLKGSNFGKTNDTSFSRISTSYFELPVMFSARLTKNKLPLSLLVGGQFAVMFRNSVNKSYGRTGTVKNDLPFNRFDFGPIIGFKQEIGSGMALQLTSKIGFNNIYTQTFKDRTDNPDLDNPNKDYSDLFPTFKDGTHKAYNISFELAIMF